MIKHEPIFDTDKICEHYSKEDIVDIKYTRKQLSDAFDTIADPSNWKLPVTGIVKLDELDLYNEACLFFTGGPLTVEYIQGDRAAVSGAGYYQIIGS